MADKRVFSIEINGVEKSFKDVNTLLEGLSKLPPIIEQVNKSTASASKVVSDSNKQSKERKVVLSDEEKAEKKLWETIDKVKTARTEASRAQIDANTAAKNAQREVQLEQNLLNAATNSIAEQRAQLSLLTNEWKNTDMNSERFVELRDKIKEVSDALKEQESLTGNNTRDVGNYAKATEGLKEQLDNLSVGVNAVADNTKGMLNLFQSGMQTFSAFGDQSEITKQILSDVGKITTELSLVQKLYNDLLSKSIITGKAKIVTDALVTRGIITQSTAQKALNIATAAFPILALIALLGTFISLTSSATEKTNSFKSALDGVSFASKEAMDKHDGFVRSIRDLQIDIDLSNGKLTEYQANLLKISNWKADELTKSLDEFNTELNDIFKTTRNWNFWDDLGAAFSVTDSWDEAVAKTAKKTEELQRKYDSITGGIKTVANTKTEDENAKHNNKILKQNEDNRIANLSGMKQSIAQIELARQAELKQAESDNAKAIEMNKELPKEKQVALADLAAIDAKYDKQASEARQNAAKQGQSQREQMLSKQKAILLKELDLLRKAEDDKTNLIKDEFDRREQQVETLYRRQREDLQKQLDTDKDLTETSREAIRQLIVNIDQHLYEDQKAIAQERNEKLMSETKSYLDMMVDDYQQAYSDIADMPKTVNLSNGLIDVEASRKNYDAINLQLQNYIKNLQESKTEITEYYDDLIDSYNKDSLEYAQANQEKKTAIRSLNSEIKNVNKEIVTNTQESLDLQNQYWKEYAQKINETLGIISNISNSIFESMNSVMQSSIDASKEKLEEITTAYDDAVSKREESDSRLEALTERAKSAEGNRSEAIVSQLNKEMETNKALSDQESALAKQKEKLEADIAKKEKKQKKTAAGQQVLQTAINTAVGVTAVYPNIPLSIIIGAMGAAQTAIAAANYAKMEKGGYIEGKRHTQGGEIRELEGGEMVINREATRQNRALLEAINNNNTVPFSSTSENIVNVREITTNLESMSPSAIFSDSDLGKKIDQLNDTFLNKEFNSVVSVVDINQGQKSTALVDNYSGT